MGAILEGWCASKNIKSAFRKSSRVEEQNATTSYLETWDATQIVWKALSLRAMSRYR